MQLETGLKKYETLTRSDYFNKNQELSKKLWSSETPTVGDICDFLENGENEKMSQIFDFFGNREDFEKMLNNTKHAYDQEQSTAFIRKVMSANNDDISKAGYFYKLLMASADDIIIEGKDCKSQGVIFNVGDLNEEIYNYRVRFMYVNEYKDFIRLNYEGFISWANEKGIKEISVKTPMTCNFFMKKKSAISNVRCFCKKCCGTLPSNVVNVGTFTTLMVTENATQSALSSMNKGRKENINDIICTGYNGEFNWSSIKEWINELTDSLMNDNVSSRFYEIALLSRVRLDEKNGKPFVASLKSSINYSGNIFGAYIFNSNLKNFYKMLEEKEFEDNSLKLQIAMNQYIFSNNGD